MTLEESTTATGEWADTHKPIVVAVDGSERNRAAVLWAAHEAADTGCVLTLVTAVEDHVVATPHFSVRSQDQEALDMLADVRHEVHHVVAEHQVRSEVVAGSPVDVLLDRAREARLLVVGKRGLGTFTRIIVGSTSIALAGRAHVPVAIVPDKWHPEEHRGAPIVLGIDPYKVDQPPVDLAFRRAARLGVPLVLVHGWETPTVYSWDAAAVAGVTSEWEQQAREEFERLAGTWHARFPDVDLRVVHRNQHPAMAVLDAAEDAQLVVLGRHTDSKLGGFTFGSVARAVLHYSECPVVVAPADKAGHHA
ncbi:universal stress protein [Nocardioides sp. WL0053]|uniref:Universal stress protein n=1 Tax=Nocardioides jiangsuensis TaxID=2866161 RepID=A0ABS7RQB3_9ACTN|nr:universal stress protein [Nocardioides jiangsuensis]MBY9076105.1 universal stress protein [Nocardioides jiangsuensis]